jgi:uncharacterized protein (TIGR03643 family)
MKLPELNSETIDRVLEMAWEDRTTFESIDAPRDASFEFSDVAQTSNR